MKKMLYITNIPTPYRNYRFNKMAAIFKAAGIELEVLFMNASEPDRNWPLDDGAMQYDYQIFSHAEVGRKLGMWMHISPKMHRYLMKTDYDIAVLGGLASPAHFIASLLLKKKKLNLLSVESNPDSIVNKGGLATRVKAFLMRRFSFFQVTGDRSIQFIRHYVPNVPDENFVTLPNVIDEEVFTSATADMVPAKFADIFAAERSAGNLIAFIPARLIDEKGLEPFLSVVNASDKMSIIIAGEGYLRPQIEEIIASRNINVHLLGEVSQTEVAGMMKLADVMMLPSKSDASPLSVIEATCAGLPLLVSRNIGNVDDVLVPGKNGWSFEFGNDADARKAIDDMLSVGPEALERMQKQAKTIFAERFSTETVLSNYLKRLQELLD